MIVKVQSNGFEDLDGLAFSEIVNHRNTLFIDVNNKQNFVFINHAGEAVVIRNDQIFPVADNQTWKNTRYKKCKYKITVEIEN